MTDIQEEKILSLLRDKGVIPHRVAIATGLSDSTIKNYITGKTKPTKTNLEAINRYFQNANIGNSNVIITNVNNSGYIDSRVYSSESPDILKHEINKLDSIIVDKEEQVRTLTEQVRTLTEQVRTLTEQVRTLTSSLAKKDEQISKLIEKIK